MMAEQLADHVIRTESDDKRLTTIRMLVSPAAEPAPALAHRLLVRDLSHKPGNAAPFYYRALLQFRHGDRQAQEKVGDSYRQWHEQPLSELPIAEIRETLALFELVLEHDLHEATHRSYCDWDFRERGQSGLDTVSYTLAEIDDLRELSQLLALRARLATYERRYDDALEALQQGYQLARDASTPLYLVAARVGIAQAGMMNYQLVDMIAAPGSPNLYWALAELPRPFINMRRAFRFEMSLGFRLFPFLKDAETAAHSLQEWSRLLGDCVARISELRGKVPKHWLGRGWQADLGVMAMVLQGYSRAKQTLLAGGMNDQQIEAMPVAQVVAIAAARAYQHVSDELEKWWYAPYPEAKEKRAEVERKLGEEGYYRDLRCGKEFIPIASSLLPGGLHAMRDRQVQLERELAALRVIEAIRMHAMGDGGQLPETLASVTVVPVPINPMTRHPFEYNVSGETAVLELPKSDGSDTDRRYEITIRR